MFLRYEYLAVLRKIGNQLIDLPLDPDAARCVVGLTQACLSAWLSI
jgi:hypothetical protein